MYYALQCAEAMVLKAESAKYVTFLVLAWKSLDVKLCHWHNIDLKNKTLADALVVCIHQPEKKTKTLYATFISTLVYI